MRLLALEVTNFASYAHLKLDFEHSGLTLIAGATGSGKSTIPDMVCWALFGVTAKGGTVEEVKSWQTPEEQTKAVLTAETKDGRIRITRIRGTSQTNDLYWILDDETKHRGKDAKDTQKRLEDLLGIDSTLYFSASYFSEFSDLGRFFLAPAKDRRAIFERIASFDLAIRLAERVSNERKETKRLLAIAQGNYAKISGRLDQIRESAGKMQRNSKAYAEKQEKHLEYLRAKHQNFEKEKKEKLSAITLKYDRWEEERAAHLKDCDEKIAELLPQVAKREDWATKLKELESHYKKVKTDKCPTCGGPADQTEVDAVLEALSTAQKQIAKIDVAQQILNSTQRTRDIDAKATNPYMAEYTTLKSAKNTVQEEIDRELKSVNPYIASISDLMTDLAATEFATKEAEKSISVFEQRITALTQLYDLSFELRGEMLRKAVQEIESLTNERLEKYFDAEFKVRFTLADADSLEVGIEKSGYPCAYKQLSKGQRGLLKLAFVTSVMKSAANKAGIHFSTLFFDEALDGLDTSLKVKAFGLFQELAEEHENVFLIDHAPEFQNLFTKRYQVSMHEDRSYIEIDE